jgi:hypothetical protein
MVTAVAERAADQHQLLSSSTPSARKKSLPPFDLAEIDDSPSLVRLSVSYDDLMQVPSSPSKRKDEGNNNNNNNNKKCIVM